MDLYQEEILDHYKFPRNKKHVENATYRTVAKNPFCGDQLTMEMRVVDGIVEDVGFQGEGCAISQASMSMLTEKVMSKKLTEAQQLSEDDILGMLGVTVNPGRLKCALLSLNALKSIQDVGDVHEKS